MRISGLKWALGDLRKNTLNDNHTASPHSQLDNSVHKFKLLNLALLQNSQRIIH